ncbi:MAG: DsbC family protein [Proteobacteria bacterium]|nr:DsbC family protein [Pseudomonadota bacterium]
MQIKLISQVILSLFALVSFQFAHANTADQDASKIRDTLKQHFSEITLDKIEPSPVKGVYQVSSGANILYVTADARYAFSGDLIDLHHAQNNLTEDARKTARLNSLKNLGQENMIIFSPKNPKYTVTVFTDVDCGYCRKMQSEMGKINNLGIAVRYLAFPRSGPDTPTFNKMVSVWCAKDKNKALAAAKSDGSVDDITCPNNSVLKDLELGMQLGVSGTPTIIFEDGTMIPGYLPPDKLLEVAKQLKKKETA